MGESSREAEASSDSPSPPTPRSPLIRALRSDAAKRTRSQPDVSHCHACGGLCCGRRLRLLPSEWRIVLLCPPCLSLLHSKTICSYCLLPAGDRSLDCRSCSSRIHHSCVHVEQRYLSPSEARSGAFTCVDCNALPKSFSVTGFLSSLEDAVREARLVADGKAMVAAQARDNAVKKMEAASCASERASKLLEALEDIGVKQNSELARQLHLEMNGSQRISRSGCNGEAQGLPTYPSKSIGTGENEEDISFFDSTKSSDWSFSDSISRDNEDQRKSLEYGCSFSDFICGENEDQRKEADNPGGDDIFVAESNMNDRYSMKYSRRMSRLKETFIREEHQPVPCWPNYYSKRCRTCPDVQSGNSMVSLPFSSTKK